MMMKSSFFIRYLLWVALVSWKLQRHVTCSFSTLPSRLNLMHPYPFQQYSNINTINSIRFVPKHVRIFTDTSTSSKATTITPRVLLMQIQAKNHSSWPSSKLKSFHNWTKILDYFQLLRPITILQAVGALWIGHLALLTSSPSSACSLSLLSSFRSSQNIFSFLAASMSTFLSYGCGMLLNDLVDVETDSRHVEKQHRALASGSISVTAGWRFATF